MSYKVTLHSPKGKDGRADECYEIGLLAAEHEDCKASGREVELHELTFAQRETCEGASSVRYFGDGSYEIQGVIKARTLWCLAGLQCEAKDLLQYSSDELAEIKNLVEQRATRGLDPTESAS